MEILLSFLAGFLILSTSISLAYLVGHVFCRAVGNGEYFESTDKLFIGVAVTGISLGVVVLSILIGNEILNIGG